MTHPSEPARTIRPIAPATLWLLVLTLLGGALRLWDLAGKSFWVDPLQAMHEAATWEGLWAACRTGNTPPLRHLLMHGLMGLDPPEAWVRLPSALGAIGTIPMLFVIVRRIAGVRAAIAATALWAVTPWQVFHAQDGRMYALLLLAVTGQVWFASRLLGRPRRRDWVLLGLMMSASAYVSYFGLWTSFTIAIFFIGLAAFGWMRQRSATPLRAHLGGLALCLVVAAAGYAPWAWNMRDMFTRYEIAPGLQHPDLGSLLAPAEAHAQADAPRTEPAPLMPREFSTRFDRAYFRDFLEKFSGLPGPASPALPVLALVGWGWLACKRPRHAWLFAAWFLVPVAILLITSVRHFFPPRYLIFWQPVLFVLAGVGLDALGRAAGARRGRWIVALATVALAALMLRGTLAYYPTEKQDWRGAVDYLEANAPAGSVILTGQAWSERGVLHYRARQAERGPTRRFIIVPHLTDMRRLADWLRSEHRLYFVNWATLPENYRTLFEGYLEPEAVFPGTLGDITIYRRRPGVFGPPPTP